MNRRKFMLGLGGTVAGSAAVLGSGAFTSFNADRTASVSVAGDSTAFLGLDAATTAGSYEGTITSNLVQMNGDSELEITLDGTVSDGDGVNDEATMQFGEITNGDAPDPRPADGTTEAGDNDAVAFVGFNQFDQTIDLTVTDDGDSTGTADILELPYIVIDTADQTMVESGADLTGVTVTGFQQSHELHAVVLVDTQTASDLSGSQEVANVNFSATPN